MKDRTFILRGSTYNKEFAFMSDENLRFKGKNYEIKKGFTELRIE